MACKSSTLAVTFDHGTLHTKCTQCDTFVATTATHHHPHDTDYSIIKLREIYFSLISGISHKGVKMNEALLTGGHTDNKSFTKCCLFIYDEMNPSLLEMMMESRKAIFRNYREELHRTPDVNSILNVNIS